MVTQPKSNAFALGVFVATLCPIAAAIGMLVCGIEEGVRIPFEDAAFDGAKYVFGYLVTATIGYAATTEFFPAARSRLLTARSWIFPVVCGIAVSAATMLVEPTTDVLGQFVGHGHENLMLAGSVLFWSAAATAAVLGIDRVVCRLGRSDESAKGPEG